MGVKRLQLPPGVDVNAYACQSADASRALASLLEEASVIVTHASDGAEPHGRTAPPNPGQRGAILYTIIESCRRRGLDPYAYLRDVLSRLPSMTMSQIKDVILAP